MNKLTEKELTVIERIGDNSGRISQRQIAVGAGFSLGLTNIILKKLARRGYIKMKHLTHKRRMHYILTKKGMIEKGEKYYNYIFKTISEIHRIKSIVRQLIISEYENGSRCFGVIGNGEIADVIESYCLDIPNVGIRRFVNKPPGKDTEDLDIILNCGSNLEVKSNIAKPRVINLIDYFADHKG